MPYVFRLLFQSHRQSESEQYLGFMVDKRRGIKPSLAHRPGLAEIQLTCF